MATAVTTLKDINIFKGIPYREKFLIYDTNGAPYHFESGVFSGYIGSLFVSPANGMIEFDRRDGEVLVDIPETTTELLSAGSETFTLTFSPFEGAPVTIVSGTATIMARMKVSLGPSGTAWDDLRVATSASSRGTLRAPDLVKVRDNGAASTGVWAYGFDTGTEEEVHFEVQMPHAWKEGSDLHPHMHWTILTNGGAGDVVHWGLEYTFADIGGLFPTTTIINTVSGDVVPVEDPKVAYRHYMSEFSTTIPGTGKSLSSMLLCRLFRDVANDDYGADAIALEFDIHYEIDAWGSPEEYSKP